MFSINHDYHIHTHLSSCSRDPEQTARSIVATCEARGYDTICITDHCWDSAVPGASGWYAPQDLDHIFSDHPLPRTDMRLLFGCETEYLGGDRLGLSKAAFDRLDYVNIPVSHFHMAGFVRPESVQTSAQYAELLVRRIDELSRLDLPFHKIGVAHMSYTFQKGEALEQTLELADESALRRAFSRLARNGAGIELNPSCFPDGVWQKDERYLRLYRFALEEGCRFYIGSDAHHPAGLLNVDALSAVAEKIGIDDSRRFIIK